MRSVDDVLPLIFIVVIFMQTSTICAVATAPGGALGVVRVAGPDALAGPRADAGARTDSCARSRADAGS